MVSIKIGDKCFFNKLCLQRHYLIYLQIPENTSLPFLAYGSFKLGELRYNLIKEYVSEFKPVEIVGLMKEKDGIPIFFTVETKPYAWFQYKAYEIYFKKETEKQAYQIISENETNTYYNWVEFQGCNILEGIKRMRGLIEFMDYSWTFKDDPYFLNGIKACKQIFVSHTHTKDYYSEHSVFFSAQAAYMLLWTVIERFCSIKYGNISPNEKIKKLSSDQEIDWSFIYKIILRNDSIVRSNEKNNKINLNPSSSIKSILNYYYGLRSNVVHRGKDVFSDIDRITLAFEELVEIAEKLINQHYK